MTDLLTITTGVIAVVHYAGVAWLAYEIGATRNHLKAKRDAGSLQTGTATPAFGSNSGGFSR